MKAILRLSILVLFAGLSVLSVAGAGTASFLQTASAPAAGNPETGKPGKRAAAKAAPSAQEIADAKSKGMVWANLGTHVYHKDGSSMYGTTKRGKFMTEDDAKKAGFRVANESGSSKKRTADAATTK